MILVHPPSDFKWGLMRISITPGNVIRYKAAFHPDVCIECLTEIEQGDAIGYLKDPPEASRYGPLCDDCLTEVGTPTYIDVQKKANKH